jgi:hypothetical protein
MLLKRWWFWLSLITIVFLAVAAVSFLAPDPVERAKTKFQQIKKGMTKAQVIEIMGSAASSFAQRAFGVRIRTWSNCRNRTWNSSDRT